MFFILSKLLIFLLSPTFWIVIIFALGYLIKNKVYKKRAYIISAILLFAFTNPLLFNIVTKTQEAKPVKYSQLKSRYDYVVALGGMAGYLEKYDKIIFHESIERLLHSLRFLQQNKADKIIISGGSAAIFIDEKKEADVLKNYLIEIGIDKNKILTDPDSRNTYENARNTAELIRTIDTCNNCCSVLLVTSALHVKRAKACFLKQGINVDVYPVHHFGKYTRADNLLEYIAPNPKTLTDWSFLFKEIIGFWVYKAKGYV